MSSAVIDRLPNGLSLCVAEMPTSHQVLVNLMVRVGSRFEPAGVSGISHFLEHMLFRGNAVHGDAQAIARVFEQAGGAPNALTGVEATEIFFVAHPDRLETGVEALSHLVRLPQFAGVEKELKIIEEEILFDYNEQGDLVHLGALTAGIMWPGHPLGQSVIGTPETLEACTREALLIHHLNFYRPENLVLGLAGRVTPEQGRDLAERFFGDWPAQAAPAGTPGKSGGPAQPELWNGPGKAPEKTAGETGWARNGPRTHLVNDPDNQFHLQLSFPAPGYNSPSEVALHLLARVLDDGSTTRLQRALREDRPLVYQVGAEVTAFQEVGQFDIGTSVKAAHLQEVLEAMTACLAEFTASGPNEEELAAAKRRYRFDLEFSRDYPQSYLDRYAWPLLYSTVREEAEELQMVDAVTASEIRDLAGEIFSADHAHLAMVGPMDSSVERGIHAALKRLG